jgi:hypothetical protein
MEVSKRQENLNFVWQKKYCPWQSEGDGHRKNVVLGVRAEVPGQLPNVLG